MAYNKIHWVDHTSPFLEAKNLNRMEDGIAGAHSSISIISPQVTNNTNAIAGLATGEHFQGLFTPASGTEYPTNPQKGYSWYLDGLTSPYSFTGGDLSGKSGDNGDKILWNGTSWSLIKKAVPASDVVLRVPDIPSMIGTDHTKYPTVVLEDEVRGGTFTYDASAGADDGGTVFSKWTRQYDTGVNTEWFNDGANDIGARIVSASKVGNIYIPKGTYAQTTQVSLVGNVNISAYGVVITADPSLLSPFVLGANGSSDMYTGDISGMTIQRTVPEDATENSGIVFTNAIESTFTDVSVKYFKYNFDLYAGSKGTLSASRVAYCMFNNCNGVGGLVNIRVASKTGCWSNENTFVGGRYWEGGNSPRAAMKNVEIGAEKGLGNGHNRFYGVTLEGVGHYSVHIIDGEQNMFNQCRHEGTWASNYIQINPGCTENSIVSSRYDAVVVDHGDRTMLVTNRSGVKAEIGLEYNVSYSRTTVVSDKFMLDLEDKYSASGNGYGIKYATPRTDGKLISLEGGGGNSFRVYSNGDTVLKRETFTGNYGLYIDNSTAVGNIANGLQIKADATKTGNMINIVDSKVGGLGTLFQVNNEGKCFAKRIQTGSGNYAEEPLKLGAWALWVDGSGRLRIKNGTPTTDTDGVVVGTQA